MKMGYVKDVKVELSVEIGRTVRNLSDLARIGEGTIIELDSICGEPVTLFAAGKPIAWGEVVVIDENFGIRVTEVMKKEAAL
jgi:flagellar motor switch protein FliN/FliY